MAAIWHDCKPRGVWIIRQGVTPLPAWPGLLIAWKELEAEGAKPVRTMGLVAFARDSGAELELKWFFFAELRPVAEEPPLCGGGHYP